MCKNISKEVVKWFSSESSELFLYFFLVLIFIQKQMEVIYDPKIEKILRIYRILHVKYHFIFPTTDF